MAINVTGRIALLCGAVVLSSIAPAAAQNPTYGNGPAASPQPGTYQTHPSTSAPPRVASAHAGDSQPQEPTVLPAQHTAAPQPGGAPAGQPGQPAERRQLNVQPPFVLNPQEQAELDKFLADWETKSEQVKLFQTSFVKFEYKPAWVNNNPNQPHSKSIGEIKYAAPDRGLLRETKRWQYVLNPATNKFDEKETDPDQYWTCDGNSVFEVHHKPEKKVIEYPIAPQNKGKAITEGPLPFVFGAKAETLKNRYYLRLIPLDPAKLPDTIMLEAIPKFQKDAANFSRVEIMLKGKDLVPFAMQIYDPEANPKNNSRTAIVFENPSVNSPWAKWQNLFGVFAKPNLIGYKHERFEAPAPVAGQPTAPGAAPNHTPGNGPVNQPAINSAAPSQLPRR